MNAMALEKQVSRNSTVFQFPDTLKQQQQQNAFSHSGEVSKAEKAVELEPTYATVNKVAKKSSGAENKAVVHPWPMKNQANPALHQQNAALHQQNPAQFQPNPAHFQPNPGLHQQNPALQQQSTVLHQQNSALHQQNPALNQNNAAPHQQNHALQQQNLALHHQNQALHQQNLALHHQQGHSNSQNPSLNHQNPALQQSNPALHHPHCNTQLRPHFRPPPQIMTQSYPGPNILQPQKVKNQPQANDDTSQANKSIDKEFLAELEKNLGLVEANANLRPEVHQQQPQNPPETTGAISKGHHMVPALLPPPQSSGRSSNRRSQYSSPPTVASTNATLGRVNYIINYELLHI